jgi:hypothetical protein
METLRWALMIALKGRNIPAQGNALGKDAKLTSPEGAGHSLGNRGYLPVALRRLLLAVVKRLGSFRRSAPAPVGRRRPGQPQRWSVVLWGRHSCLPAPTRADRNVRATLGQLLQRRASTGGATPSRLVIQHVSGYGAPATGSPGSTGSAGSTGARGRGRGRGRAGLVWDSSAACAFAFD